jgi:hypothetical protein
LFCLQLILVQRKWQASTSPSVLLPEGNKYRLPVVFLLQWTVPFLFVLQLVSLTITSLRHALVDGTPEVAGKLHTHNVWSQVHDTHLLF